MSEEWLAYVQDPRTICKYGAKCYQQNPDHHNQYKHPPAHPKPKVDTHRGRKKRFSPYSRGIKKADSGEHTPQKVKKHDTRDAAETSNMEKNDLDQPKIPTPCDSRETKKADSGEDTPQKVEKHDTRDAAETSNMEKNDLDQPKIPTPCENESTQNHVDESFTDIINQLPKDLTYHDSATVQSRYKELFLVEMPEDFFKFYECLKEENDLEKFLSSVNIQLIGPYELLLGKLPVLKNKDLYLMHWRFFYDPPEFQAVLKSKDKSEFHIGYFRDDPSAQPVFLAYNDSAKGCHITPYASNIFGAVYLYLENQKKSPFTAMTYKKAMEKIKTWAEKHNYSIEEFNAKRRTNLSIAKTLHGAGIMVPYEKKTQLGYRCLAESDANIKKLFSKLEEAKSQADKDKVLSELQPVITYANIAVDECDFGTGLEVGIDMFCSGLKELEASALNSLCSVYSLLNRAEFGTIIQAHLKCRRKGSDMSVLSIGKK